MMRTRLSLVFVLPVFLLNSSFSKPLRPGLLTDDFGIVTEQDMEREVAIIRLPAFVQVPTVFPYWRCLRPEQVEMSCEDMNVEEPRGNPIAAPHLSLVENGERYEYYTRRPWGFDACEETLSEWRNTLGSEAVVCISATVDEVDESPTAAPWRRITYGEINRMKGHAGKWSYFVDDGE
jgi:hypothetical protein